MGKPPLRGSEKLGCSKEIHKTLTLHYASNRSPRGLAFGGLKRPLGRFLKCQFGSYEAAPFAAVRLVLVHAFRKKQTNKSKKQKNAGLLRAPRTCWAKFSLSGGPILDSQRSLFVGGANREFGGNVGVFVSFQGSGLQPSHQIPFTFLQSSWAREVCGGPKKPFWRKLEKDLAFGWHPAAKFLLNVLRLVPSVSGEVRHVPKRRRMNTAPPH